MIQTVWVDAHSFKVRVVMGLPQDTSLFEEHLLRAIGRGAGTVQELANVLEVSQRILLDALGDLWRVGHVRIDFASDDERITLSPSVAERVKANTLRQLDSTYRSMDQRPLLLDRLTGRVLSVRSSQRPRDFSLRVPKRADDPVPADAEPGDLFRAVDAELRYEANQDVDLAALRQSALRVLDVYLEPNILQKSLPGNRQVPVDIAVSYEATVGLRVRVVDRFMSAHERERGTLRLQQLIDESPNSAFVQSLQGKAPVEELTEAPKLAGEIADLRQRVHALTESRPGTRQQLHDQALRDFDLVAGRADSHANRLMNVRIVDGVADHVRAIHQLIQNAQTQLIISGPWMDDVVYSQYEGTLQRALDRGVQVVVLWGINLDATLPPAMVTALQNLQRYAVDGGSGRVVVRTDMSSRIHAKLLLVDDRQAILTSYNFLRGAQRRETGLLVTARNLSSPTDATNSADTGRVPRCLPLEELLGWSVEHLPDHELAQSIVREPKTFGPREGWPSLPRVVRPKYSPQLELDPVKGPAATAWALGWEAAVAELAALAQELGPAVHVIRDVEHAHRLWHALRTCERRLLITSDQLSGTVVDAPFREAVHSCVQRGVRVTLVYANLGADDEAHRAADELETLASLHGVDGQLTVRREANNHAKVMVWDDEVIVGSFNFLSYPGHYAGRGRRRERGELSIHVSSGEVADGLFTAFGAESGSSRPEEKAQATATGTAFSVDFESAAELIELGDEISGSEIRAAVAASGSSFGVAAALDLAGAEAELVVRAAAAGINIDQSDAPRRWVERVLRFLWNQGDYGVAHRLRSAWASASASELSPSLTLTTIGAAYGGGEGLAAELESATLDASSTGQERTAALVVAAVALLTTADGGLVDVMNLLEPEAAPWARELGQVALEYFGETGLPLPVVGLQEDATKEYEAGQLAQLWAGLAEMLSRLERMQRSQGAFVSGPMTIRHLFSGTGALAMLRGCVKAHDVDAVAAWRAEQSTLDPDPWLDEQTKAAGAQRIIGGRRQSFISKVEGVFRLTAEVANAAPRGEVTLAVDALARGYAERLSELLPETRQSIQDLPADEATLARHALERLTGLVTGQHVAIPRVGPNDVHLWRYPELRAYLDTEPATVDPAVVVHRLCTDVVERRSPSESIDWLVERGEYKVAASVLNELADAHLLAIDDTRRFEEELDRAVHDVHERFAAIEYDLRERLARLGIVAGGVVVPDVAGIALGSRDAIEARLNELSTRVLDEELDKKRELLAQLPDVDDLGMDEAATGRAAYVRELIGMGEYAAAEAAIAAEPLDFADKLPTRTTERAWAHDSAALPEIASWLKSAASSVVPAGVRAFIPAIADEAGQRLVVALDNLASKRDGAARGWLTAVAGLVGAVEDREVVRDADGVCLRMKIPEDLWLPTFPITGREGYLWRMGSGGVDDEAEVLFSTELRPPSRPRTVVLGIGDVLTLLPLAPGEIVRAVETRRERLLRLVGRQLEPDQVVTEQALEWSPERLRGGVGWLLHLMGFEAPMPQSDILLEATGGHRRVLRMAILSETRRARASATRHRFDVRETRKTADYGRRLRQEVLESLSAAAAAVLFACITYGRVSGEDELQLILEEIADAGEPRDMIRDLPAALKELHEAGYLPAWRPGPAGPTELSLCGCGVVRRLAAGLDSADGPEETARDALRRHTSDAESRARQRAEQRVRAEAGDAGVHVVKNLFGIMAARADPDAVTSQIMAAWSNEQVVDVSRVCRIVRDIVPKPDEIVVEIDPTVGDEARVSLSMAHLVVALLDLVTNAAEAAVANLERGAVAAVYLSVTADTEFVTIGIQDTGDGIPDEVWDAVVAWGDVPSNKDGGEGTGLLTSRVLVELCRGRLINRGRSRNLGGAWLDIELPRAPSDS